MNSRPSRSSSIPIPRSASASARNIESLISIPLASPGRQPTSPISSARQFAEPRRVGHSDGSRATTSNANISLTPVRSSPRSVSLVSSVPGRASTRTPFEPRVIRGSGAENHPTDPECLPQPATSPSQTRRISSGNIRGSGSQQSIVPQHIARATPVSFPRPAYLDYSSLRHLLQTEVTSLPTSVRKVESPPSLGSRAQPYLSSMSPQSDDDDSIATPPPQSRPSSVPLSQQDQFFKLPTRWSEQDRHQNLSVSLDGRELSYHGAPSNGDKDAAAARANNPIPAACGIYYFEVEMLGKEQKAHVTIGFAGKSVKFGRLPGWEPNSWGYYGEDGHALAADKTGSIYGSSFGTGDIIGCGIDFTTHKAFYTRNGTFIGPIFDNVGKTSDVYPSVGLQHAGESIRTNFGQDPFKFDIDYFVQQQSTMAWNKILETPLDYTLLRGHPRKAGAGSIASITNDSGVNLIVGKEESKELLNQLVMSYLVHHGYARSARAFEKQQEGHRTETAEVEAIDPDVEMSKSDAVEGDIESRTNIVNSVLAGDMDAAIDAVQKNYPTVLEVEDHLILFKLRCRKFVELILETAEIKKKMKAIRTRETEYHRSADVVQNTWADEEMDMDIDEDIPISPTTRTLSGKGFGLVISASPTPAESIASQYESALNVAILYGQSLSNDYQSDPRPEVQQLFKKTFGIVAWEDPLEAGGPVAELVGHDARVALAHELNQAILKSQGRPAQPALETLYRHTAVCITQLGLSGVGAAAFADMPREFLQSP